MAVHRRTFGPVRFGRVLASVARVEDATGADGSMGAGDALAVGVVWSVDAVRSAGESPPEAPHGLARASSAAGARQRRRTRAALGVVAAVLLVSACTGTGPAPATLSPSARAASTPASSPTPPAVAKPTRPAEMDLADERGAEAAARYFFELYRYVLASGDTAEWRSMSWTTCEFCGHIADAADEDLASGATNGGGAVTLYDVEVGHDDLLDGYPVLASYSQAPATWTPRAGEPRHIPGEGGRIQIDLKRIDSVWRVLAVARAGGPIS
jgi:uncharacterized protein DUF6318